MKILIPCVFILSMSALSSWAVSIEDRIQKLSAEAGINKIEAKVYKHDSSAFSTIPSAVGSVADIFRQNSLVITNNSDVGCYPIALKPLQEPGCLISVFVSRKRNSGKYSDLAGFHAVWARGLSDKNFKPANGWAEHITNADSWIQPGGLIDTGDRP